MCEVHLWREGLCGIFFFLGGGLNFYGHTQGPVPAAMETVPGG